MNVFDIIHKNIDKAELVGPSRHGAAIVHNKEIIALGFNKKKTHPLMLKFNTDNDYKVFTHAEIDAISKVKDKSVLSECDMYVFRLSKGNVVRNSEPCDICKAALKYFRFKDVYWTQEDNDASKFGL